MQRVIIDTDPGIDDAMAILFALAAPALRVEAITTVFGNVAVEQTTRNALTILEVARREDIPVVPGADRPLLRAYRGRGELIHGRDGLGETDLPPPKGEPQAERAAAFLAARIMEAPGEITLVALGPLTNLALAVRLEPRLAERVRRVVLMGGAATTAGNASPVAEANIYNDPEAAHIVFHAGWPVTMVGLDVTHRVVMDTEYLARLQEARTPAVDFILKVTAHYLRHYRKRLQMDGFYVHDPTAVAYVIRPDLFQTRRVYVDVALGEGRCSGQTMADWRGQWQQEPNVEVCVDVDATGVLALYQELVTSLGR